MEPAHRVLWHDAVEPIVAIRNRIDEQNQPPTALVGSPRNFLLGWVALTAMRTRDSIPADQLRQERSMARKVNPGANVGRNRWRRLPRLKLVAAGAGRDGTMTMAKLIEELARINGESWKVEHELYSNHICNLLCSWRETSRHCYRQALEDLLKNLPAHAVSGTNYQFALDILAEKYGRSLKIVHLKRRDKRAFVESLGRIIHFRPGMAVNMTDETCRLDHPDHTTRLAAFHFGEMGREEWEALDVERRLEWHYEKTHALLGEAGRYFDNYFMIYTEDLDRPETLRRLARFIDPRWGKICRPVRLNARSWWEERAEFNEKVRHEMLAGPGGRGGKSD